jgi:hypothetical protein
LRDRFNAILSSGPDRGNTTHNGFSKVTLSAFIMPQDYDAVFGADQATINNLIITVYNALKPSGLFKQTVKVNEVDISTVILDITKPFVVTLQASKSSISIEYFRIIISY